MDPREIYRSSLGIYHGDKYDGVVYFFDLVEKHPEYGRCFYHDFFLIFSIKKNNTIYINTNIVLSRQFELENGIKWNHLQALNSLGGSGHTHPTQILRYEEDLSVVLKYIRNKKIENIL